MWAIGSRSSPASPAAAGESEERGAAAEARRAIALRAEQHGRLGFDGRAVAFERVVAERRGADPGRPREGAGAVAALRAEDPLGDADQAQLLRAVEELDRGLGAINAGAMAVSDIVARL